MDEWHNGRGGRKEEGQGKGIGQQGQKGKRKNERYPWAMDIG